MVFYQHAWEVVSMQHVLTYSYTLFKNSPMLMNSMLINTSSLFVGCLMCWLFNVLKSVPLNIKWSLKNMNLVLESP